jgi:hypothetical protein
MNSLRKIHVGSLDTRHAEIDAMLKLPRQRKISRLTPISLIVIRINKSNELKNSKPCYNCLMRLQKLYSFGYNLCNIYYSDQNGEIIKKKYIDLLHEENKHISRGNKYKF